MAGKCENCGNEVEAYRDNTNVCENCMIEILTDGELQERYSWF
jgi:DNA-directed RNA polymerase subunit RPC12/RpoP